MNKLVTKLMFMVAFLLFAADVMAQVPQGFNFQAVARDANGDLIINTELGVRVTVLQGAEDGTAVYTETLAPTTTGVGSFQIVIGEGTSEDDFSGINWASDNYYVKLEIDPAGGEEYEELGTTRLLSVPYALLARDVVNGGGENGTEVSLPLTMTGGNGNISITLAGHEGDNNYGFLGLGNADGDTLAQVYVENRGDTASRGQLWLSDTYGRHSNIIPGEFSTGFKDGGLRAHLTANNLMFRNWDLQTPAPSAWFGTLQGKGFYQLLDYSETGTYQGGILTGFWPGQPTIRLEDGNEEPLVILEAQKNENRNVGVLTLRGSDGSEFSITSDGIEGSGAGSVTQYDLNSSNGDTSFTINTTGASGLAGLRINANTDDQNIGIRSSALSKSSSTAIQVGSWSSATGEAGANHYGVIAQSNSKAKYNYGVFGDSRGEGNGESETDPANGDFGSFNLGGYFQASENINGNTGVQGVAAGTSGSLRNFGVIGTARTTTDGRNIGMRAEAFNSNSENTGVEAVASGSTKNIGLRAQAFNGGSNIALIADADTAAKLNGHVSINGGLNVNSDLYSLNSNSQDPNGNDPDGKAAEMLMFGDSSPNVQIGGQLWEDADLGFIQLWGSTEDGNGWYKSNAFLGVGSDGTNEWGSLSLSKTNISGQTGEETILLDGNSGNINISGSLSQSSDERLKKDIVTLDNALAKTMQLRGVSYNWKSDELNEKPQIGVIAQEVEEIYPEFVHTDDDGMKSVNYAQMTAILIEAVKELNAQILNLKNENEALQAKADKQSELESRLAQIEKLLGQNSSASASSDDVSTKK